MTFRDKNRIVASLKDMQRPVQNPRPKAPILYKFVADRSERTLTHTCSLTRFAKVIDFTVVAFLNESSNLIIETEYDIHDLQGAFSGLESPLIWRPDSSLDNCLDDAMRHYSPSHYGSGRLGEITILKVVPDGGSFWEGFYSRRWKEFRFKTTKNSGNKSEIGRA